MTELWTELAWPEMKTKFGNHLRRVILTVRREVEAMTAEKEMLRQHLKSMNDRLKCLEKMAGVRDSVGGDEEYGLSLKIEEINDKVSTLGLPKR